MAIVVKRAKRKGRSRSAETTAALEAVGKAMAPKAKREQVTVEDEAGTVLETYTAVILKPESVGRPATYTGMRGLIALWAKENGRSVTVSEVGERTYAVREVTAKKKG